MRRTRILGQLTVTIATRFTPVSFILSKTTFVPSVSIVGPTSFVFPPSATTTPSMPSLNTFATSAGFVTSPAMRVRLGSEILPPACDPPDPSGITRFDGFLLTFS